MTHRHKYRNIFHVYIFLCIYFSAHCYPTCTWSGFLPQSTDEPVAYSPKVFLGGVPWDVTEAILISTFKQFGPVRVEWPAKAPSAQPKGYAYIIFESEKQVCALISQHNQHLFNQSIRLIFV